MWRIFGAGVSVGLSAGQSSAANACATAPKLQTQSPEPAAWAHCPLAAYLAFQYLARPAALSLDPMLYK